MLEPYEGKLSRTVLRGERGSNAPALPDKNWTFTVSANDIFNTWRQRFDTITNTVNYSSDIKGASRSISLSIRYTLNTAKGKYKGRTSRQDEIDRL